jgi:hypothetical protein
MTTKYPEHQKLKAVRAKSQAVGEFLDWLTAEKRITLAVAHEHTASCREDGLRCGYSAGDYLPASASTRELLAEFFDIDESKIENEKRAMLAELRGDDDSGLAQRTGSAP